MLELGRLSQRVDEGFPVLEPGTAPLSPAERGNRGEFTGANLEPHVRTGTHNLPAKPVRSTIPVTSA